LQPHALPQTVVIFTSRRSVTVPNDGLSAVTCLQESFVATNGSGWVRLSFTQPCWACDQFFVILMWRFFLLWNALSDERKSPLVRMTAGPRRRRRSLIPVQWNSLPNFNASTLGLLEPGAPDPKGRVADGQSASMSRYRTRASSQRLDFNCCRIFAVFFL
jgi:hypothetical protein